MRSNVKRSNASTRKAIEEEGGALDEHGERAEVHAFVGRVCSFAFYAEPIQAIDQRGDKRDVGSASATGVERLYGSVPEVLTPLQQSPSQCSPNRGLG